MADKQISYAQLTHEVVKDSPEPLPVDEILRRVHALRPVKTKNPKRTIRSAIGQSRMIVFTGDGRYGWKLRLINGSVLRHTIQAAELSQNQLYWDEDVRDALWPTFFAAQKYKSRGPISVEISDNKTSDFHLKMFSPGIWGTSATPDFWAWFHILKAGPGDHLLIEVLDGEAGRYRIAFQARADRDEAAVAARNQAAVEIGLKLMQRPYGIAPWDLTTHLLATGFYRHPVPPDPFSEWWHEGILAPTFYGPEPESAQPEIENLASLLFGQAAQEYDFQDPPDLAPEYDPYLGRRHARRSRKALRASVTSFLLRVNHRALPEVWRDIELAEDNTLEDLHLEIQSAFGWGDDHLYSFFLSGDASDESSEIGSPWSESSLHTHQVQVSQLNLQKDQTFLYFFDYGDSHEFDLTVLEINPLAPKADYPRIVAFHGQAPPQYPEIDEKSGEMSWDPYRHWRT